jgi:membrane associated rhomboid family serine protease
MEEFLARIFNRPAPELLIGSVLFVSMVAWLSDPLLHALLLQPYRVRRSGQVYRLLTAGWVHKDLAHLAFNMLTLYFFADQAMKVLGVTRFLALYVSAVVVAFLPTTLRHSGDRGYSSLGASGAVAAVMFSAILLHPKLRLQLMFLPFPVSGAVFAAAYLAYSLWNTLGSRDGVNHGAHFSGALYGALFTYWCEPARVERTVRTLW